MDLFSSSEVTFSFLIKISTQGAMEIATAFLHPLGNDKSGMMDYFFMLKMSMMVSPQNDTYIDNLAEIFLKLSTKNSRSAFNYWDDFKDMLQN